MRFGGVNKKLDQLATIIDETMLSSPMPLDPLSQPREPTLRDEIVSALEGFKEVAQKLMDSGTEENKALARQLMVHRQAVKLLAREHFPASPQHRR